MKKTFGIPRARSGGWLNRWRLVLLLAGFAGLLFWASSEAGGQTSSTSQPAKSDSTSKNKAIRVPGADKSLSPTELAKLIDAEITLRLAQDKVPTSPRCDDSEFIRRVSIDLAGVIPTVEKVKAFLDSSDPQKREKLIEELLQTSSYAHQQAEIWTTLLVPNDIDTRQLATDSLMKWLQDSFGKNKPWNKIVEEMVTASGTIEGNGATTLFIANPMVDKVTDQVCKLFLGVHLQCAQCHNHPFTDWKQDEYWGMAAFFMKVKQTGSPKQAAKDGSSISIAEEVGGGAFKAGKKKKGNNLPEGAKIVPPKFLGGDRANVSANSPLRPALAKWLTSTKNPYFAKAAVNRMWGYFFGRGFVNPIDDMHDANPATHPELLAALGEQLKRNDFDLKYLMQAILLSDTYQRSSRPVDGNETDAELFSRMYVKTLTPEQLFDSIGQVVGPNAVAKGGAAGKGAGAGGKKGPGPVGPRTQFIRFFRVDEGDALEYQDGIPQALRLMNSPLLNNGGKALEESLKMKTNAQAIDHLYLSTLSRHATQEEVDRRIAYISRAPNPRMGYTDILWALLNSSEFRLNH
jgi:hypothetical protein